MRLQIEQRGLQLHVDLLNGAPPILADRDQIERVIVNLITNATRATPPGGAITLSATRRGGEVAFSVSDTGTGIPRDYLAKIFEPFAQVPQAPAGGSGWTDHLPADRRGPRRSIDCAVGAGSRFHLHVYGSDKRSDHKPPGQGYWRWPVGSVRGENMKVLIVDDEPHIRQMMRLTLEAAGSEIDETASGEDALSQYGGPGVHDVVLLDQKMPGIDGLHTLKRLKERTSDARVVMVTAFGSIELAVDAMKLGATDFLRKPMTPENLRGAVAAAVANRPQSSAAKTPHHPLRRSRSTGSGA